MRLIFQPAEEVMPGGAHDVLAVDRRRFEAVLDGLTSDGEGAGERLRDAVRTMENAR